MWRSLGTLATNLCVWPGYELLNHLSKRIFIHTFSNRSFPQKNKVSNSSLTSMELSKASIWLASSSLLSKDSSGNERVHWSSSFFQRFRSNHQLIVHYLLITSAMTQLKMLQIWLVNTSSQLKRIILPIIQKIREMP